ncbi:MAG TPA: hypothetical protein VFF04_06665 [Candidatus Babeliales bacterium]|nr:hypothetical protein [Candidatus Babeliales bacterium]
MKLRNLGLVIAAALMLLQGDMAFAGCRSGRCGKKVVAKKCAGGTCQRYARKSKVVHAKRAHMSRNANPRRKGCVGTCARKAMANKAAGRKHYHKHNTRMHRTHHHVRKGGCKGGACRRG